MGDNGILFCGEDTKQIAQADAEKALMYYSSRAGVSGPSEAWTMLTDESRVSRSLPAFAEQWKPFPWAEVVETPATIEGTFNVFTVDVRKYYAAGDPTNPVKGRVQVFHATVGLQSVNGAVRIDEEDMKVRRSDDRVEYPRAQLPTPHVTYVNAVLDEDSVVLPLSQQVLGGSLSILCKPDESTSPRQTGKGDVDQWYRTPQGYLPASAVPAAKTDAVTTCDPRYIESPYSSSG